MSRAMMRSRTGISSVFIGLFESDLTVEHYDRGQIRVLAVRPFECAGMPHLCAGSGFEGAMPRYRAHIEMIE
jgi:hypothetical protein